MKSYMKPSREVVVAAKLALVYASIARWESERIRAIRALRKLDRMRRKYLQLA